MRIRISSKIFNYPKAKSLAYKMFLINQARFKNLVDKKNLK